MPHVIKHLQLFTSSYNFLFIFLMLGISCIHTSVFRRKNRHGLYISQDTNNWLGNCALDAPVIQQNLYNKHCNKWNLCLKSDKKTPKNCYIFTLLIAYVKWCYGLLLFDKQNTFTAPSVVHVTSDETWLL